MKEVQEGRREVSEGEEDKSGISQRESELGRERGKERKKEEEIRKRRRERVREGERHRGSEREGVRK